MTLSNQPERVSPAGVSGENSLSVDVCDADAVALQRYREDCAEAGFMPAQSPDWVSAWTRHAPHPSIIVRLCDGQAHLMSLALEVVEQGRFRIARFISNRHANGNFPALDLRVRDGLPETYLTKLRDGIRQARPEIDALVLERQLRQCNGQENPLLGWPHGDSPNVSLAVNLDGGFDAVLARSSGKRKRKQHRSQARKLEAAGKVERRLARSRAEAEEMLNAFFDMKAHRFSQMGIQDVFAPDAVKNAFRTLFGDAAETKETNFVLHGLEVAGKLRAVTGSSRIGDRLICEFSSIADDDLTDASPGRFLFYQNIEEACSEGLKIYDFSVGDEYYKRLWCDVETIQFDTFVPLTGKGRILAFGLSAAARAKHVINNDPRLWRVAKALRRRLGSAHG
ncbi:GNAT family N-acetyltransferase [Nitratireductor kimnyeongensis]|uniref:GNAT family N-acetyltransferase n=1 Tax=Nitratireductor kimnyeongensis TaxID=430679 RepID=A0ABW0T438_9HYPH|nr:GNAT family N-acetyltransferase [Nitratireductor kimnyeongensis]QZZ35219.1 GNAT family N-acetyltransferase [Nitratireductor kimnyeongensis]